MARTRRAPGEAPRASGSRDPVRVRDHVMVDEGLWSFFHKEWRRIEREWRGGSVTVADIELRVAPDSYSKTVSSGMLEAIAMGVDAARAELRATVRKMAPDFPGSYLVPV